MKKLFVVLGGIFSVLLVALLGFAGYMKVIGKDLDHKSKIFVDKNAPLILHDWNKDVLLALASPEFIKSIDENKMDSHFTLFLKTLGSLKKYKGSKGEAQIFMSPKMGKVVRASYVAEADFEHGSAQVQIGMIQRDQDWQIIIFRVDSDTTLERINHTPLH